MFYVCQGTCLCGTINNRGKVIYCYGDAVPRQGEAAPAAIPGLDEAGFKNPSAVATSRHILVAQLAVWTVGILAILILLFLIRTSVHSLRRRVEKAAFLHFGIRLKDEPEADAAAQQSREQSADGGESGEVDLHLHAHGAAAGAAAKDGAGDKVTRVRITRKDLKKTGGGLRGKDVTEAFRVKDKDLKRTMK